MANTKKRSFWVHALYCVLAVFVLLFVSSMVAGPEQVAAALNMIGDMTGKAIGAVVGGIVLIVMIVMIVWCLLMM